MAPRGVSLARLWSAVARHRFGFFYGCVGAIQNPKRRRAAALQSRSSLRLRPEDSAWSCCTDAEESAAPGDVQGAQIVAAEGAVGDLVARHRQKREQLAFRTQNVDAPFFVRG